jgi:hypothetical protein
MNEKKKALGEELTKVLKKMCSCAKVKFRDVDFSKKEWYLKHTWANDDEQKFRKWLEDYLYNDAEARKEIMTFPMKNKAMIRRTIDWFMSNYSWAVR